MNLYEEIIRLEELGYSKRRIMEKLKIGYSKLKRIKENKKDDEEKKTKKIKVKRKDVENIYFMLDFETNEFNGKDGNEINIIFGVLVRFDLIGNIYESYVVKEKLDFMQYLKPYIENPKYYVIIYTHNLKFDENLIFSKLINDYNLVCRPILSNGATIVSNYIHLVKKSENEILKEKKAKLKRKQKYTSDELSLENIEITKQYKEIRVFEFRDSYLLLRSSIEKLGEFVGKEKLEYDDIEKDKITKKGIEYCYRDCEIAIIALQKLYDMINNELNIKMKTMPYTVSSLCLKIFIHYNITTNENGQKVCECLPPENHIEKIFESESYFGGRSEAFNFQIQNEVYGYDMNSLYPACMINHDFPLPPYRMVSYHEFVDLNDSNIFAMKVELIENSHFPLIPIRDKKHGIVFRNGRKICNLFKFEYEYLKQNPLNEIKIISVYKCNGYKQPFNYMQYFYDKKKNNDSMRHFYKLLLNSTYGVFGKKLDREVIYLLPKDYEYIPEEFGDVDYENELDIHYGGGSASNVYYCRFKKKMIFMRNVVYACQITAAGRLKLTKNIDRIANVIGYNNILYCDTDSIFVNKNIDNLIIIDDELGNWKLEKTGNNFIVLAPKEYMITSNDDVYIKSKGLKKKPNQGKITVEDIINFHDNQVGFESWSLTGKKSILNGKLLTVTEKITIKKSRNDYFKRLINEDMTTSPHDEYTFDCENLKYENELKYQKIITDMKLKMSNV